MQLNWTTTRMLALAAVLLVAAGTTIAIGTPRALFEPMLGADWQCNRTALVVTTCSHSIPKT
ncbi:hypothetical protein CO683_41225 [Bradyrhizobium ottawaense]|nr:hypothetical protein CO683_41225 [Bradyrhizobium ottawaense]GMO10817.1 hypothetical protein BwSH12_77180 [Bradyrhizobium ottawaense]GMO11349.1 hypothetical protein BwSH20_77100 [Bradyrhizobium ottawaense]GMO39250.1 hypothetical protein BwSH14_49090 [Bradyrhizobium ottawaense]GMO49553.1 hypothetical protein BwSF21_69840 [Bradyrhizobium ottawaense]